MSLCCHLQSANGTEGLNVEGVLKFCSSNSWIVFYFYLFIYWLRERTRIAIGNPAVNESSEKLAFMRDRFERLDFTASVKHR
jgi:hypothetical protein